MINSDYDFQTTAEATQVLGSMFEDTKEGQRQFESLMISASIRERDLFSLEAPGLNSLREG